MASHDDQRTYSVSTDNDNEDEYEEIIEDDDENEYSDHEGSCNKIQESCSVGRGRNDHKVVGLLNMIGLFFSRNKLIDPKAQWVQEWNRVFLLVCAIGLFVDPLFFYAISISESCMCLFVDGWFAVAVTVLRAMSDGLHVWNMWLQFKMTINRNNTRNVSYLKANKGFLFDIFVILPLPQLVMWIGIPTLLEKGLTTTVMTVLLIVFLFQYLPKIYHSICLLRRIQNLSGYIFGTVWWGIALNTIAYFVASHAVGACWYLLGIQRAAKCLKEQCIVTKGCGLKMLACEEPIYYGTTTLVKHKNDRILMWGETSNARFTCLNNNGNNFDYGAYKWTVQLVTNENHFEKILLPIFWGLMTLSTFGNLESTTDWLEVIFIIIVLTSGLILVTMFIGNIKVFLHAKTSKKQAMQLKMRDIEWWMKKRRLPREIKQRTRNFQRQKWAAMRGVDECEMIQNLPEGLRRDIKYHLCLDLVRQVPLFQHMDNLVLENICDRVKSMIFTKGETITREGDPVQRMFFIVRGHLQSSQILRDGVKSCCMLGPGNFSGDELLSWCLRRPFIERLPPSSSTLVTLETTEAFSLEAEDVKYVTQHFRYTFVNEKVKRSARYYSPGWRTWAAVAIQLAWRRYKHRLTLTSLSFIRPRRPLSRSSSLGEDHFDWP
ncbi:Cyclic nucleotide-gated ion channel 4 [Datura stramonium]|uniref:Cyclic nucleotide-gated ion channel 4 n=1 Tax=Datura stramonium TaxID=4076 RepID=A0ABS8SZY7_DATST|nr:Cyclic nucleotide-gated ion channel 4 [Datura stramonium]